MRHFYIVLLALLCTPLFCSCLATNSRTGYKRIHGDQPRNPYQVKSTSLSVIPENLRTQLENYGKQRSCLLLNDNGTAIGSATVISKEGLALTTYQIMSKSKQIRAQLHNGNIVPVTLHSYSTVNDIAMIKIKSNSWLPYFPMTTEADLEFDQVMVAASSNQSDGTISGGYMVGKNVSQWLADKRFMYQLILHTAPVYANDFGGPLMNLDGTLVGIHVDCNKSVSTAISTASIFELYQDLSNGGSVVGISPKDTLAEAKMSVPGLLAYAVHESDVSDREQTVESLMTQLPKYQKLYIFLKEKLNDPSERFVKMVQNDIALLDK